MSEARALYVSLHRRGISLRYDGERLVASPSSALTAEDRAAIAENKPALLALCRQAELERAEFAVWSAWWGKQERFGDTPPDDLRAGARAASDECLALHARYMALVDQP